MSIIFILTVLGNAGMLISTKLKIPYPVKVVLLRLTLGWMDLLLDPLGNADKASSAVGQFFMLSVFMYQSTEKYISMYQQSAS